MNGIEDNINEVDGYVSWTGYGSEVTCVSNHES